jgi:hypothetical protein
MLRTCVICLTLGGLAYPAGAYYIAWEGDCLPEETGWTRVYGDWSGIPHGTGAIRGIDDGVMTMDSLYDSGVFDIAEMYRQFSPGPGELLVMEWRLAVDQVAGLWDPGIALSSDDGWVVGFKYNEDAVLSPLDTSLYAAIAPAEFHDYRMTSWDMRTYQLFIDGALAREGPFVYCADSPRLAWGDGTQGAASLHRWDYVRIYTIPEPFCLALCGAMFLLLSRRRLAVDPFRFHATGEAQALARAGSDSPRCSAV